MQSSSPLCKCLFTKFHEKTLTQSWDMEGGFPEPSPPVQQQTQNTPGQIGLNIVYALENHPFLRKAAVIFCGICIGNWDQSKQKLKFFALR